MFGDHLAFKPTYEEIRQTYRWSTIREDAHKRCTQCQTRQHHQTAHNRPKLPTGHIPVGRPFQRVSVDLVEYKTISNSSAGVPYKYVMPMTDHLTRYGLFFYRFRTNHLSHSRKCWSSVFLQLMAYQNRCTLIRAKEFENRSVYITCRRSSSLRRCTQRRSALHKSQFQNKYTQIHTPC